MASTQEKPVDTKQEEKDEKKTPEEEEEEPVVIDDADLSDEDRLLKEELEMAVSRLREDDASLYAPALNYMRDQIRTATSSMTSVPKPLKFLRPFFSELKQLYEKMQGEEKRHCADVVSLLAMTHETTGRECLNFCFKGSRENIGTWGHEYVRHLQAQIAEDFKERIETQGEDVSVDDLLELTKQIIPYHMKHNAEADACDLLMEIERLDLLEQHVDEVNFERVCLYLSSCVPFVPEPEDTVLLKTCLSIFRKFSQWPSALQMALKINDVELIKSVFRDCKDRDTRRQLAFMLGRQQYMFDLEEEFEWDEDEEEECETLRNLMANSFLSESFLALARELDITEPKAPEDVYKTNVDGARAAADSARANLASSFVNAFVNAGFGNDKLIIGAERPLAWMFRNKDEGKMSAAASLGMLLLWDVDGGLTQIDACMLADDKYIKAGALLAIGIVNSTVRDEHEPALALLQDHVMSDDRLMRIGAIMGLGLAYAGTMNEVVTELLLPILDEDDTDISVLSTAAIALAQIHVGACTGEVAESLIQMLLLKESEHDTPHARLCALAIGLIFLGKQAAAEVAINTLQVIEGVFGKVACTIVETCAYAGTGNVLKVQNLLHTCSEHFDAPEDEKAPAPDLHQAYATLGIALISMGEEISVEMSLRVMNHLLQYGEPVIRRAVPLAMGALCTSNPQLSVLDILSKLSHEPDRQVAHNSILAMGLVGAGTNHARISNMLRHLAQYYSKDPDTLFVVRIAQGLVHAAKGVITMSPFHTDRTLMSPAAMSGLLPFLFACADGGDLLLKNAHFMIYHLAVAMYPRILSTFDADLKPTSVSVRVGQAVDVAGQAGKPKTITGFVTNNTPVLLGHGERAQLASDEYKSLTPILEGFVIVKKAEEDEDGDAKMSSA